MIGQRIRWRHVAANTGERMFPERAGIAHSVVYAPASASWRVLVAHSDGTFSDQPVEHMELDRDGAPSPPVAGARDQVRDLYEYILAEGLADGAHLAEAPCIVAVDLLKQFQTELLQIGERADAVDRTCSDLATERDEALKRIDELTAELESVKKRKPGRPAGRTSSSEDAS